jgi:hypothetical protein
LEDFAKSLSICKYIRSDDEIGYSSLLNSIEEGTAQLFGVALANAEGGEIFKKMFHSSLYLQSLVEETYYILKDLYSDSGDFLDKQDILEELLEMSIGDPHDTGGRFILFLYQAYKKDGKADIKQLLRDVIFSPAKCEEKLSKEIKNDENEELLKSALSDALPEFNASQEFRRYQRHAEEIGRFGEELKQKTESELKAKIKN